MAAHLRSRPAGRGRLEVDIKPARARHCSCGELPILGG